VRRYRYQLEAFVDKVRGRTPEHWYDPQDSIANMEWIEAVYKEVCRRFFPAEYPLTVVFLRLGLDLVRHRLPRYRQPCKYNLRIFSRHV
jgi:hypothetical protein